MVVNKDQYASAGVTTTVLLTHFMNGTPFLYNCCCIPLHQKHTFIVTGLKVERALQREHLGCL